MVLTSPQPDLAQATLGGRVVAATYTPVPGGQDDDADDADDDADRTFDALRHDPAHILQVCLPVARPTLCDA